MYTEIKTFSILHATHWEFNLSQKQRSLDVFLLNFPQFYCFEWILLSFDFTVLKKKPCHADSKHTKNLPWSQMPVFLDQFFSAFMRELRESCEAVNTSRDSVEFTASLKEENQEKTSGTTV